MRAEAYCKISPHTLGREVREAIIEKMGKQPVLTGPVSLRLRFVFLREPGNRKPVPQMEQPPTFALVRAVMNELPGVLYDQERQVVSIHAVREYGNVNMVEVKC